MFLLRGIYYASVSALALGALPSVAHGADKEGPATAWEASRAIDDSDMVTTGVARGRERLDSATSTSSIKENEMNRLGARPLADLLRNVPGIRVEAAVGEGLNNYTVRGLPLSGDGAKYVQLQEDGLPVLEFGVIAVAVPDVFLRADFNIAQIQSIRGGSSSTFASNAPGGVINLISKTGEVEGGSIQQTVGVDYDMYRTDFDYGSRLGGGWRFHIGGFYRAGEGPRASQLSSFHGGQLKLNVTKEFAGGYIRLNGKLLDDKFLPYFTAPLHVTGTNADPKYSDVPNFSTRENSVVSPYLKSTSGLSSDNTPTTYDYTDGVRVKAKTVGLEAQLTVGEFTISERFRYADLSELNNNWYAVSAAPAQAFTEGLARPGARLTYASGPLVGQAFNPSRGSGLLSLSGGGLSTMPISTMCPTICG